jgi:hypothetical protein
MQHVSNNTEEVKLDVVEVKCDVVEVKHDVEEVKRGVEEVKCLWFSVCISSVFETESSEQGHR